VSSYYYAKKREAEPTAREIRDAMLEEKIMAVRKGRKGRALSCKGCSATRLLRNAVELSCGMKQPDRRRGIMRDVLLLAALHRE